MTQPQQVLPGGPASVSIDLAEKEERIQRATNMVGKLARVSPPNVSQMEFDHDRREAGDVLVHLGIGRVLFGSLVISYNQRGPSGIRAFLERHFSSWDGEGGELQS